MSPEERLGRLLRSKGLTMGVAESCTGGLISKRITDVAGASDYFRAGLVTYSNEAKEAFLRVPSALIAEKGAVSREVAELMAEGVRAATGADIGLSVTGIAGPAGGTAQKPVGTVYMGLSAQGTLACRHRLLPGDRASVRGASADEAIGLVIDYLEGRPV